MAKKEARIRAKINDLTAKITALSKQKDILLKARLRLQREADKLGKNYTSLQARLRLQREEDKLETKQDRIMDRENLLWGKVLDLETALRALSDQAKPIRLQKDRWVYRRLYIRREGSFYRTNYFEDYGPSTLTAKTLKALQAKIDKKLTFLEKLPEWLCG